MYYLFTYRPIIKLTKKAKSADDREREDIIIV